MSTTRRIALSLALVGTLAPGSALAEETTPQPWNREITGLAVVPSGPGNELEVQVVWTAKIGQPSPSGLNLSTDVLVRVGDFSSTHSVPLFANPGAGYCSDVNCGGSCGTGSVSGKAATLLCLPDGAGCACQFPAITTRVPLPPGNHDNDMVQVLLVPSAGAQPELDKSDDDAAEPFKPAIFWDRSFRSVEVQPIPGAVDTYNVVVELQVAYNGSMPPTDLRTNIVMDHNGNTAVFEPWCGPWLLAPTSICGQNCLDETCAVIKCSGQTVATLSCQTYENAWGQFGCTCASAPLQFVIPSVKLKPGDHVDLSLVAAPGAIPEIDGLDHDQWLVCSKDASSLTYGKGKAGTLGVPVLDSIAPPVLGQLSGIRMKQALPGALPILFIGAKAIDVKFDAGSLLVEPGLLLFVPTPVAADGTVSLGGMIPADPNLCGVSLNYQFMFQDSGAAGFHHLAMTNGLSWVFGT